MIRAKTGNLFWVRAWTKRSERRLPFITTATRPAHRFDRFKERPTLIRVLRTTPQSIKPRNSMFLRHLFWVQRLLRSVPVPCQNMATLVYKKYRRLAEMTGPRHESLHLICTGPTKHYTADYLLRIPC